jgi:hypothetical protein
LTNVGFLAHLRSQYFWTLAITTDTYTSGGQK